MNQMLKQYQILDNFQLKILAIFLMAIDHIGLTLFPQIPVLRLIGRTAFPIFCFLLVEGFFHTKNVYRYGLRLGIFAIISQIPFIFMIYGWGNGSASMLRHWNVFVTLFLGLLFMWGSRELQKRIPILPIAIILQVILVIFLCWFANKVHCDYHDMGILLIALFYYVKAYNQGPLTLFFLLSAWAIAYGDTELYAIFAAIPILMYNGEKGRSLKYFFYGFYPAHLLLLSFLANF